MLLFFRDTFTSQSNTSGGSGTVLLREERGRKGKGGGGGGEGRGGGRRGVHDRRQLNNEKNDQHRCQHKYGGNDDEGKTICAAGKKGGTKAKPTSEVAAPHPAPQSSRRRILHVLHERSPRRVLRARAVNRHLRAAFSLPENTEREREERRGEERGGEERGGENSREACCQARGGRTPGKEERHICNTSVLKTMCHLRGGGGVPVCCDR